MGTHYVEVHLWWTLPPALLLGLGLRRLATRRQTYKTVGLIIIAIVATIPWDSYLIRNKIWSYPASSVLGPTLFAIPLEEIFFFFVQTYITANIYHVCSRPVVHALLLPRAPKQARAASIIASRGVAMWLGVYGVAAGALWKGAWEWTYMSLIMVWAAPFLALLWGVASSHILALPAYASVLPVAIPTVYLWICDASALRRGTWVIEPDTKLGLDLGGLEIEEAVFFFVTNLLVVWGLVAIDYCLAVYDLDSKASSRGPSIRSLLKHLRTVFAPFADLPFRKLSDLHAATGCLAEKSKSFYVSSFVFEGRLQLDLLILYSWCRVVDDLIDEALSPGQAVASVAFIAQYLDFTYADPKDPPPRTLSPADWDQLDRLLKPVPVASRPPFRLLTELPIPRGPLDELVAGFRTDLAFTHASAGPASVIVTEADLDKYASNVASSVADLCVRLAWSRSAEPPPPPVEAAATVAAARCMGQALQLVNIARDVAADAHLGRVYLPGVLRDALTADDGLAGVTDTRKGLLRRARALAAESYGAIERLPREVRGGMRAACCVYLEIGEAVEAALREGRLGERARVPAGRRLWTAWRALA